MQRHHRSESRDNLTQGHGNESRLLYLVGVYIAVLFVALLVFWQCLPLAGVGTGKIAMFQLAAFLASVVALVVLIVSLPLADPPVERYEYDGIVLYQRPPIDESCQVWLRVLLGVAWFIPLVLLGSLLLGYLSNPESRVGRILTGLPEPCSTERTLSCPEGVDDPTLCRLQAKTTVCGREKITMVYDS